MPLPQTRKIDIIPVFQMKENISIQTAFSQIFSTLRKIFLRATRVGILWRTIIFYVRKGHEIENKKNTFLFQNIAQLSIRETQALLHEFFEYSFEEYSNTRAFFEYLVGIFQYACIFRIDSFSSLTIVLSL